VLKQDYDSLSDIWSAGVVMYILLCGHPPFKGSTETGTLRQVKAGGCSGEEGLQLAAQTIRTAAGKNTFCTGI
jgi:serine/threonine protein kinase